MVEEVQIHAAVRSEEQAKSLSGLDVSVLQVDLSDGKALEGYLVENDGKFDLSSRQCIGIDTPDRLVDIVINTATSIDSNAVLNLVSALGRRQSLTGKKTYFVHVGILIEHCISKY